MTPEAPAAPERVPRPALALATAGGLGFAPIAPGTFGSLPGIGVAWALDGVASGWALAGALVAVTALGTWAAGVVARRTNKKDPGLVVVDEVAGQMTTLLFLPTTPIVLASGFLLFRVLDILKPFPARALERLPGGSGIMADDLMVGIYANVILQAAVGFLPGLLGSR